MHLIGNIDIFLCVVESRISTKSIGNRTKSAVFVLEHSFYYLRNYEVSTNFVFVTTRVNDNPILKRTQHERKEF